MLLTYLRHGEQSPSWAANWLEASQEIPRILWNPKVHFLIHKFPLTLPMPGQLDPVHALTYYFLKIHLNVILPSTPRSPTWHSGFPTKTRYTTFTYTCYMPCPSHSPFDHLNNIRWALSSSLCSFLYSPVTSSLLVPNILLNILFSNTLSICSSLNINDQVQHPYKTKGILVVLTAH